MKKSFILFFISIFLLVGTKAMADTHYVGSGGEDAGDCTTQLPPCATLAYAISQASVDDIVEVAAGTYELTSTLTIDKPLTLRGADASSTIIVNNVALTELIKVSILAGTPTVTIQDLTLQNASGDLTTCLNVPGTSEAGVAADVVVNSVNFETCGAEDGGGIRILNSTSLSVSLSNFTDNFAHNSVGGAIMALETEEVEIEDTLISGASSSGNSAAIYAENLNSFSMARTTITGSTNDADATVYIGGVTAATLDNVTIVDSTILGATDVAADLAIVSSTSATLNHVTIYNTDTTDNYSVRVDASSVATLSHSIIYKTDATSFACNNMGTMTANAFNLSNDESCFVSGFNDLVNVADPFADVTLTNDDLIGEVPILPVIYSSTAFNAGDTVCAVNHDARSIDRPQFANCDIGAFESTCGNGVDDSEQAGDQISLEECDDGNFIDADGCSALCQIESTWYADADGDGYGDSTTSILAANQPLGYVSDDTDCDDNNADVSPDAEDICDLIDNDCNGTADDDFAEDLGDACSVGLGACEETGVLVCSDDGTTTECDASAGSASDELCGDEIDNDCDGDTDEGFDDVGDACSAGVGACEESGVMICSDDGLSTECNALSGEAVTEVCDDEIDNDCDGALDSDDSDCDVTKESSGGCGLQTNNNHRDSFGMMAYLVIMAGFIGLRLQNRT